MRAFKEPRSNPAQDITFFHGQSPGLPCQGCDRPLTLGESYLDSALEFSSDNFENHPMRVLTPRLTVLALVLLWACADLPDVEQPKGAAGMAGLETGGSAGGRPSPSSNLS